MDPITAAIALMAFSKIIGGFGSLLGGSAKQRALDQAAVVARKEGSINAQIALDQGERTGAHAAIEAAANAGGAAVGGGAMATLEDLGRQSMFNARTAIYRGDSEAIRDINEGRVARKEGQRGMLTKFADAGASFLSQSGQQAEAKAAAGTSSKPAYQSFGSDTGGY